MEKATFGAGCFWGIEESFQKIPGVISTKVGYCGGEIINPTYREVCGGKTGHAEVVVVEFDPKKITYERLLEVFWKIHDPTSLNKQGLDIGYQYRSVIFYHNLEQKEMAENSLKKLQEKTEKKIMTSIEPVKNFFPAEEYHQKYLEKRKKFSS